MGVQSIFHSLIFYLYLRDKQTPCRYQRLSFLHSFRAITLLRHFSQLPHPSLTSKLHIDICFAALPASKRLQHYCAIIHGIWQIAILLSHLLSPIAFFQLYTCSLLLFYRHTLDGGISVLSQRFSWSKNIYSTFPKPLV